MLSRSYSELPRDGLSRLLIRIILQQSDQQRDPLLGKMFLLQNTAAFM